MATGSSYWGTSKGKLGNIVLRVRKGQTVESKYQPNVTNPRTFAQCRQRALFANAVKFYKSAIARMFKFAFEDKAANESDYNAFMRHNVSLGMILKKYMSESSYFPAIGMNWVLSSGSLSPFVVNAGMDRPYLELPADISLAEYNLAEKRLPAVRIADLSNYLIAAFGCQNGDLFTLVRVMTQWDSLDNEELFDEPYWQVLQIRVDATNFNPYGSVYPTNATVAQIEFDDAAHAMYFANAVQPYAEGYAAIWSRQTSTGLRVSTQELVINDVAMSIFYDSFEQPYYNEALGTWGADTGAVLQGAIADGAMETVTVGIKDLKKAQLAEVSTTDGSELTEETAAAIYGLMVSEGDKAAFRFNSTGKPNANQVYTPVAVPANGYDAEGNDAYPALFFIFEEPIVSGAFVNTDFKITWTSVDGSVYEKEGDQIEIKSFNPTQGSRSLYMLRVHWEQEDLTPAQIPEYNIDNAQLYYKGVYIGRSSVVWYRNSK